MNRSLPIAWFLGFAGVVAASDQDVPKAIPVEPEKASYQLRANDQVELKVIGEPELTTATRILMTGEAVFPYIDAVEIAGMRLQQATEKIKSLYAKDYLRDPQLILTVTEHATESVLVLGEVNAPGQVPIPISGKLDMAEALAAAGWLAVNHGGITELIDMREGNEQRARRIKLRPGDSVKVAGRLF